MSVQTRALPVLALLLILNAVAPAAWAVTGQQASAINLLRQYDPHGFWVYQQAGRDFLQPEYWTEPDTVGNLATAIHESVHALTAQLGAYPLVDGTTARFPGPERYGQEAYGNADLEDIEYIEYADGRDQGYPAPAPKPRSQREGAFFPPTELSPQLYPELDLAGIYIFEQHKPDQPSSVYLFSALLDELNAYTNDLATTTQVVRFKSGLDSSRDGAVAFMYFLELYIARAAYHHPETWAALFNSAARGTIQKLWAQGETVVSKSCVAGVTGDQDQWYLHQLCDTRIQAPLSLVLGRAPVCPSTCLQTVMDSI